MKIGFRIVNVQAMLFMLCLVLTGCSNTQVSDGGNDVTNDIPMDGGTTVTTDYDAPKTINSDRLMGFSINFFRYGEYGRESDSNYSFKIETDDEGKMTLCGSGYKANNLVIDVDSSVADGVQNIIKKYDLAQYNGIHRKTAGLAPEFDTSEFYALYDSGETINFSDNNNPYSEWTKELLDYFTEVFHQQGKDDFMPPEAATKVARFELEYTDGDIVHIFGEISGSDEGTNQIQAVMLDRKGQIEDETVCADSSDKYYKYLQKLVKETEIEKFANKEQLPSDFDYDTEKYYSFYIEFVYGNSLCGFSDKPEEVEKFLPVADKFCSFCEDYVYSGGDI